MSTQFSLRDELLRFRQALVGFLAVQRDVSERTRVERALRDSEARLRLAQQLGRVGNWTWEIAGDTVTWSDELYRIFGREPSAGAPSFAQQHATYTPESWVLLKTAVEKAVDTGEHFELELEVVRADQTRGWTIGRGEPSRDAMGRIVGLVGTVQDVTDRRQLEEQLRQAQKMEAIGHFAGGIAHDLNNLLMPIIGYSELLAMEIAGNPRLLADLDEIRKAADHAARLVRQLVGFSRKQMLTPQALDLNNVISELGRMLRRVIGEDVQLKIVAAPELGRARLDPGQVEQLVMNLAVNGRHAMPKGGMLTIATANTVLDEQFVGRHPGMLPGRYVELRVADTGCGMPPDVLARVFEPFFTTKPQGQGTGLGLSTVYDVVKQSGGYVTIESEPGVGTTVTSYFPSVDDPIEASTTEATEPSLDGNETILLVEDDVAIRELAGKVLDSYGYTVLAAQDVAEAIALGTDHAGPIHLLLSDVVMPDLSGPDLAQRLVRRRPALRVLYMSGFSNYRATHLGGISKQAGFISKPFTPEALASRVRQVLDRGAAPSEQESASL
jgi:signal transduction histidine kinase/CheY-like chemotaxis protein